MGLFGKKESAPKPPARPGGEQTQQPQPSTEKPPSLGNTIDAIKKRKKMLDEI